ncbi:MAG: AAA family ATPase [Burkholderiales bacterium]|nr:AAA family ATPase [Burkholderiales bacterium]
MDKKVVFAVAGSGKTTSIIERLDLARRFLIVTFTHANRDNLRAKIIEKFGWLPDNIVLMTYFSFLYGFCYRPILGARMADKGISYRPPGKEARRFSIRDDRYFMGAGRRLYSNRIARLVEAKGAFADVNQRLEKYYDLLCVDEVQDIAGHDFNLLLSLCGATIDIYLVGDFYQHTFDTSRDGAINTRLHEDYEAYKKRFAKAGLVVDTQSLAASRRCAPEICDFITRDLKIAIKSSEESTGNVVEVGTQMEVDDLVARDDVVKLFIQEHYRYGCRSQNWGASKGEDSHMDVCVVLHDAAGKARAGGGLAGMPAQTVNKLYVACSRARRNLYLAPAKMFKKHRTD